MCRLSQCELQLHLQLLLCSYGGMLLAQSCTVLHTDCTTINAWQQTKRHCMQAWGTITIRAYIETTLHVQAVEYQGASAPLQEHTRNVYANRHKCVVV